MRFCLAMVLLVAALGAHAQQFQAAPLVGKWDYSENRCGVQQNGYGSETDAAEGGAQRNYGHLMRCPWYVQPAAWGTLQSPMPGSCGSTNYYPEYIWGVESINVRHYFFYYKDGVDCQNDYIRDSFVVYRARPVGCPAGYVATGNSCIRNGIDPNKNNNTCLVGPNGSNPIHSALGTKLQYESDIDLGNGLQFSRYYSSASHWGATAMGSHWRHSLDATVLLSDASVAGGPITAWVKRPNGDIFAFNRVDDATWTGEPDVTLQVSPSYSSPGIISGWSVRDHDGHVEFYNSDGRLVAIESPSDGRLALSYDANGRLQSIVDRNGRVLVFQYDASNRISDIGNAAGGIYHYEYTASGNLYRVTYPYLSGDAAPQRTYHYEDTRFPNALTGITDESGNRYASWEYDASARAISSTHGLPGGSIDHVSLTYNADGTTTVTDASNATRTYSFSQDHGVNRFAGVTQPCVLCGGSNSRSRTYDANGYPDVETNFAGTTTDNNYSARGLIVQKIESQNNTATKRIIQTDWHATFAVPTERRTYDATGALVRKETWTYNDRGQALTHMVSEP